MDRVCIPGHVLENLYSIFLVGMRYEKPQVVWFVSCFRLYSGLEFGNYITFCISELDCHHCIDKYKANSRKREKFSFQSRSHIGFIINGR